MNKLKGKGNALIIVTVLLILIYIFYQCYSVTHIQLETETALTTTVYETIDTTALVIRSEHVIANSSNGITVPCLDDGDKINVGGNVAMTFSSSQAATDYSKYCEIQKQLEYYQNAQSQTVGQAASVESINEEIDDDIDTYIRSISSNDADLISKSGSAVNHNLLRRQMIIGENVDLVSIIQDLRKQMESYSANTKPTSYVTTDVSGVFSGYTDGYEDLIDYDSAKTLTADQVKEALDEVSSVQDCSANLGKLVTGYVWYLDCVVSADAVKNLKNGYYIYIALKDSGDKVLKVKIIDGAEPDLGAEETVLVLECNDMDANLASLRSEQIEIRTNSYTGIKAPASALHVVDGKKGVYALISSQVRFREADVIYSDDDYVLLSYDIDNKNGIRLYDKIITQGKDLEDGKVYT